MPIESAEIVARLCRVAAQNHFPLGAVRVQKLVYLIECEYFRWNQIRLTSERWIYYHYGPWSPTLDALLRQRFDIRPEVLSDGREFKDVRYDESDFHRLPERFADFELQGVFEGIVEEWLFSPLAQLLDFVYFHTPPMKDVQRGKPLDFTTITPARGLREPLDFLALAGRKHRRREQVMQALVHWRDAAARPEPARLPSDDAMFEAIEQMDRHEATPPVEGEILLSRADAERLEEEPR